MKLLNLFASEEAIFFQCDYCKVVQHAQRKHLIAKCRVDLTFHVTQRFKKVNISMGTRVDNNQVTLSSDSSCSITLSWN